MAVTCHPGTGCCACGILHKNAVSSVEAIPSPISFPSVSSIRRLLSLCHHRCPLEQSAGFLQARWLCLAWCPQHVPDAPALPACLPVMHCKHSNLCSGKLVM